MSKILDKNVYRFSYQRSLNGNKGYRLRILEVGFRGLDKQSVISRATDLTRLRAKSGARDR